jgi:transposase
MKYDDSPEIYEGIPATIAMASALMESTGIRKLIDRRCRESGDTAARKLSVGMAVKAMAGAMFEESVKPPLYHVNDSYNTCPADLVFGKGVTPASLNDTSLAKCLDVLSGTDTEELLWDCSALLCGRFGLNSDIMSMDATNYPLCGMGREGAEDGAAPAFGGNSKTNRNDLVQKNIHSVTDGNGILRTSRSFGGSVSDMRMNNDMIEFLDGRVDPEKVIISADCKLANSVTVDRLLELRWGFVTKAPSNFNGLVKDGVAGSAVSGQMDPSERYEGRYLYDTEADYGKGKLRFVAYRLPGGIGQSSEYLTGRGFERAEKRISRFKSRKFFCRDDAEKAFGELMEGYGGVYRADIVFTEDARLKREDPNGPHWRGRPGEVSLIPDKAAEAAERFSVQVLVTDLPFSLADKEDLRKGTSSDTVVDLYLGQYHSEKNFRIMKSGMGVNHMYLHTHSRQDAMVFVVSLATALSNTVDSVLAALPGKKRTTHQLMYGFKNGIVKYDRSGDTMRFGGPPGMQEDFMGILDSLKIDKKFLLGF